LASISARIGATVSRICILGWSSRTRVAFSLLSRISARLPLQFIGSIDSDSLDPATNALERLRAQGRTVGVISHVQAMKDRILVQLEVHNTDWEGASEVGLVVG